MSLNYTPEELKKILADHAEYLKDPRSKYNLRANLRGANLRDADLRDANLRGAKMHGANLRGANLRDANLRGANLYGADLRDADLRDANLRDANLRGAKMEKADLERTRITPVGEFTAFKKVRTPTGFAVLQLLIPEDARRWGGLVGRKCRADKATVVGVMVDGKAKKTKQVFTSTHDPKFVYEIGASYEVKDFLDDARIECAPGIHFFITQIEAEEYGI